MSETITIQIPTRIHEPPSHLIQKDNRGTVLGFNEKFMIFDENDRFLRIGRGNLVGQEEEWRTFTANCESVLTDAKSVTLQGKKCSAKHIQQIVVTNPIYRKFKQIQKASANEKPLLEQQMLQRNDVARNRFWNFNAINFAELARRKQKQRDFERKYRFRDQEGDLMDEFGNYPSPQEMQETPITVTNVPSFFYQKNNWNVPYVVTKSIEHYFDNVDINILRCNRLRSETQEKIIYKKGQFQPEGSSRTVCEIQLSTRPNSENFQMIHDPTSNRPAERQPLNINMPHRISTAFTMKSNVIIS